MRRHALLAFPVLALVAVSTTAFADDGALTERQLGTTDAPYGFVEYTPPGYSTGTDDHPIIVFLHGLGEEGNGTTALYDAVTKHGPEKLIKAGSTYFGDHGILVFAPQSPDWWNAGTMHGYLDWIVGHYRVDPRRIYLTGLSMGGGGTWDYAHDHGDKLAAIMPIAGASGPSDGTKLVGLPVWAFHDWDDGTVTRTNSIGWANSIATAIMGSTSPDVLGGYPNTNGDSSLAAPTPMTAHFDGSAWSWVTDVDPPTSTHLNLTLYPDGGHDAWTKTYDDQAVFDWLLAQAKAMPPELSTDAIIVDNLDIGASFTGPWSRSQDEAGFYGWDEQRANAGADVAATYTTTLPSAGKYEVKLRYTSGADHASIPVEIVRAGGSDSVQVDMTEGGGAFVSLGIFDFDGPATIVLHGEAVTGTVVADAVAFELQSDAPSSSVSSAGPGATGSGSGAGPSASAGAGGASNGGENADDDGLEGHACSIGNQAGSSSSWALFTTLGLVELGRRARRGVKPWRLC